MKDFFAKLMTEITQKLSIHATLLAFAITLWIGYALWWKQSWCCVLAILFSLLFVINFIFQNSEKWKTSIRKRKIVRCYQSAKWREGVYKNLRQEHKEILWSLYQQRTGVVLHAESTDVIYLERLGLIRHSQNGYYNMDINGDGGAMLQYFLQPVSQIIIEEHAEDYKKYIKRRQRKGMRYE